MNKIFGQVLLRDPDALGRVNCVDTQTLVDIVGIDHNIAHKCEEMCEYLYEEESHREQCRNLPVKQIEKIVVIHKKLEHPSNRELESIDPDDFKAYIDISISPFYSSINGDKSKREIKAVLSWMIHNPRIIKLIEEVDPELFVIIIRRLFQNHIEGLDPNTPIHRLFTQHVSVKMFGERISVSFAEAIIGGRYKDKDITEWFYNYIITNSEACSAGKEISIGCFTIFCEMGKDIHRDIRTDWLFYAGNFETYIAGIITAQINGTASPNENQWNTNDITDVDYVNDFYEELCGNLATVKE